MQEQIDEVFYYINGTLKHKWLAINIAWLLCVVGWVYVSMMPDKYESAAQVHVDSKSMLKPLLRGLTVQTDVSPYIGVLQKLMFTRENLEQIAELSGMNPDAKSEAEKIILIENFRDNIKISGGRNDVFNISYIGFDAYLAKAVVLAVLTVFSEKSQEKTSTDADATIRFLDDRIHEYEVRLRNAEKTRENFKRVNLDLLLDKESGLTGRMIGLKEQLESAKLLLSEAKSRRNVLNRQMQEIINSKEDWRNAAVPLQLSPEQLKIQKLKIRRDELLLKFTERHPEIIAINNSINEMDRRNQLEPQDGDNGTDIATALVNPYVQELKITLNTADAEVASARSRVNSLTMRMAKLEESMKSRLSIESDMKALNRDYESIKNSYLKLVESREQAMMSVKARNQSDALTFKIADPPSLPLEPSSPNRLLLFTIVMIAGIVVGFGVALLVFFIKPSFMSIKQLRSTIHLPVLGSVSYMPPNTDIERNKKIFFALVILSLFVVYFIIVAIQIT